MGLGIPEKSRSKATAGLNELKNFRLFLEDLEDFKDLFDFRRISNKVYFGQYGVNGENR